MDQILLWISLAAGLLAVANSLVRNRRPLSSASEYRRVAIAALLLVAGAAAISLVQQAPFSPGQTLWPGLLLGAVVTLFGSSVAVPDGAPVTEEAEIGAWGSRFGAAAAGLALLLLPYASRALDVMSGYALGALAVAVLYAGTLQLTSPDSDEARSRSTGAERTALLVAALAAAEYLATFHRGPTGLREWQPLPALLAAAAGLLLSVRAIVAAPAGRGWLYGVALVGIPLAVVAGIAAARLNGTLPFLWVVLLGFGLFAVITLLGALTVPSAESADAGAVAASPARLIAALLVVGGGVIAFRELHGFGLALLVLAGWISCAVFAGGRTSAGPGGSLVSSALGLGLMMVLYRVFVERHDYTRGFQADFLYYYAALLVGALLPALLAGLGTAPKAVATSQASGASATFSSPWGPALLRMVLTGMIAGLSPLAVWMLIGDRPEAALVVGLAVASLGAIGLSPLDEFRGAGLLQRLLAPTIALSAVQFTHLVVPLALRTRAQRLEILAAVTVAIVLGIVFTAWWERQGHRAEPARA